MGHMFVAPHLGKCIIRFLFYFIFNILNLNLIEIKSRLFSLSFCLK